MDNTDWSKMDKKELRYYLEIGFDYINVKLLKGCPDKEKDSLYAEYHELNNCLSSKEAREILSATLLKRLDTRTINTLKRLDKRFKEKDNE